MQIGPLSGLPLGMPQPVQVNVAGKLSNTDQTFILNPGRMLFVDNVHGNDATAVPGDITHPYRHVQLPDTTQAAFGAMQRGDIIVMRGNGVPWTDLGNDTYFVKFIYKDGGPPTGTFNFQRH